MLIVISPAKSLDFENARKIDLNTTPDFTKEAKQLVALLKKHKPLELMKLMSISDKLALQNYDRFKIWQAEANALSRQALCAFKGDVYTGMNVADWHENHFLFAQDHLRILSGLYGVLRPLDLINEYRLEMGTKLETKQGANLYEFWGNKITNTIQQQLDTQGDNVLVNLASNEYFKSVQSKKLKANIITPIFKDAKNGEYKIVSFFAKKARGMMSRYIILNALTNVEDLKHFTDGGYSYNDKLSKGYDWVFTRD